MPTALAVLIVGAPGQRFGACAQEWQLFAMGERGPNREGRPRPPGRAYNAPMDHQLIIKFWRKSLADEAFLATIEADLKQALGDSVELEGFDVSPKEINLFMLTADPRPAFRRANEVLQRIGIVNGVSAAYRLVGGARFTSVWPLRATRKFSLP